MHNLFLYSLPIFQIEIMFHIKFVQNQCPSIDWTFYFIVISKTFFLYFQKNWKTLFKIKTVK